MLRMSEFVFVPSRIWLFALLLFTANVVQASQAPIKSPNDHNNYRYLELDNGLNVLLISDPDSDKGAASLNVAVGSGDDPIGREGLAHFLEHMLFLGTEKYPEPGEYQQFIKNHGGNHNAFTAFQDTNYFFDIQADSLAAALDRFAQQFSAPLFTADLVERERRAVHSEYTAKMREDGRRYYSAKKQAFNPEHPFSHFAVGNMTTLEDTEARPLRPDLVEFWRRHYSANLMTLAVYGPQSLDRLEAMVRPRFSAIENRHLAATDHSAPLFAPGQLPELLRVEALRDMRTLTLTFPIPSQIERYHSKPAGYVASLLGHEGPGSLFDVLKNEGWAESLAAGLGTDTGHEATLEVNIELTSEGLDNRDEIIRLTFAYLDLIRSQGISEQRFTEMKQQAEINFRFQERQEPIHKVMRLAMQLRDVAPRDVLRAAWTMDTYDPQGYRAVLARLTPDNVLISELSQRELGEDVPRTRWYDTAYAIERLSGDQLAGTPRPELANELALPEPNPFLPEDLEMIAGATMDKPILLTNDDLAVWYARDTRFDTPKANLFVSLRSPIARATAQNDVLSRLYVDAIDTNLNAWAYAARLAGLNYSIYPHLRGVTIRVGGYSDKLPNLLSRILAQVAAPTLSERRFEIARRELLDKLRNQAQGRPVEQAGEFIQSTLIQGAWSTDAQIAAAEAVRFEDLQAFARQFTERLDPVMLAHGNVTEAAALNVASQVRAFLIRDAQAVTVGRSGIRKLPTGETAVELEVEHPDTGYTLYLQGSNTSFRERARFRLLAQIVGGPFYEEIRTQRQLGYIVYATSYEMLETPAIGLVVQSPEASADDIDQAVKEFSEAFEAHLDGLSDADLQQQKQAVISSVLERERQLGDVSERYWREIDRGNRDFDSREQLAVAVSSVSRDELLTAFQEALLQRNRALRVATTDQPQNNDRIVKALTDRDAVPSS